MRNIKLLIEYDGTNYCGWQVQPGLDTIQGFIESSLHKITKSHTQLIGAGRTDAGVHALGQVANFKTDSRMTPEQFKMALNSVLPKDIVIRCAEEVEDGFHARYSAIGRTYQYTILNETTPSALFRNYVYQVFQKVDVGSMDEACRLLIGTHNFASFALSGDPVRNFIRTVESAKCEIDDKGFTGYQLFLPKNKRDFDYNEGRIIKFRINANAFLRGMVRSIAGTLLEMGKGKIHPEAILDILKAEDRSKAGPSLPSKGLCLISVSFARPSPC